MNKINTNKMENLCTEISREFCDACREGNLEKVEYMLEHNTNELYIDEYSKYSDIYKHYHIAEYLLNKYPNIKLSKYIYSYIAENVKLAHLIYERRKDTHKYISYENNNAFFRACTNNYTDMIEWLLSVNPQIKEDIETLNRIFNLVCAYNNIKLAKYLFEINENITIDDSTFYGSCNVSDNIELLEWLLKINPNIDILANQNAAFNNVCYYNNIKVAKWLFEKEPKINNVELIINAFKKVKNQSYLEIGIWLASLYPNNIRNYINQELQNQELQNQELQNQNQYHLNNTERDPDYIEYCTKKEDTDKKMKIYNTILKYISNITNQNLENKKDQ